jgi:hypothetical protein
MRQTLSPSLARCYGMARVTRMWKVSRASVYRSSRRRRRTRSPVAVVRSAQARTRNWQSISASK